MSVDAENRAECFFVPTAWKNMLIPQVGTPEPDVLDLAGRHGVFIERNYQVSSDWQNLVRDADICLTRGAAKQIVDEALSFAQGRRVPQRQFVRNVISLLRKALSAEAIARLEKKSEAIHCPRAMGFVAVAIGIKEAAKFSNILAIKGGEVIPISAVGEGEIDDKNVAWLGLK